jgi:hypothetical protein
VTLVHSLELVLIALSIIPFAIQLVIENKIKEPLIEEYDFEILSAKLDPLIVGSLINPYLSFVRPPL